jgi:tetratricopeptide (TPR) repeat protein
MRIDLAFEIVIALLFYGFLLFLLFGRSLINRVAGSFSGLYSPSDENFRVRPEYSVAEARVKQGRYAEAVDEYRKVIAQYPEDVYSHLRIATLAVDHLNDLKLAELELLSAFAKATGDDPIVLAGGRLADLYQLTLKQPQRAVEVLEQLREKLPGTKHAAMAEQRIRALRELPVGSVPPTPPAKIAYRPADEERRKRWLHGS